MAFLEIKDRKIRVTAAWEDERLVEHHLYPLIEKWGLTDSSVSTGVFPSPDFGYFNLASRYWQASLATYLIGVTGGFDERGCGYTEPWLFNARHSIELYVKGFSLFSKWLEELQKDHLASGEKLQADINFRSNHDISKLYKEYKENIIKIISKWDAESPLKVPDKERILLLLASEEMLNEISGIDEKSFRFRYPSISANKNNRGHNLHKLDWKWDDTQLLPLTGLPKCPGYFFDHVKVVNAFYDLITGIRSIASAMGGYWDYVGEVQDMETDDRYY